MRRQNKRFLPLVVCGSRHRKELTSWAATRRKRIGTGHKKRDALQTSGISMIMDVCSRLRSRLVYRVGVHNQRLDTRGDSPHLGPVRYRSVDAARASVETVAISSLKTPKTRESDVRVVSLSGQRRSSLPGTDAAFFLPHVAAQ